MKFLSSSIFVLDVLLFDKSQATTTENNSQTDLVQGLDHELASQILLNKLNNFIDHSYAQRGGQNFDDYQNQVLQSFEESGEVNQIARLLTAQSEPASTADVSSDWNRLLPANPNGPVTTCNFVGEKGRLASTTCFASQCITSPNPVF